MCIMSAIFDHYQPLIPDVLTTPTFVFDVAPSLAPLPFVVVPREEYDRLTKLIADFKEAVEAAGKLDRLMGKPDCVDIEKKHLEERVAVLEKKLAAVREAAST